MRRFRKAWHRTATTLEVFFYDPDAFRFKGMMAFCLQLVGILAVGVSLQFLAHPVAVVAENREPVACFDTALFEESFTIRKTVYPEKLKEAIRALALRDWPSRSYLIQVGTVARGVPQSPAEVSHHILCWYAEPRSPARALEIRHLRDEMLRGAQGLTVMPGQPFVAQRISHAEQRARGEDEQIDTKRQREFFPNSFLLGLTDFATPAAPLDLAGVLRPSDTESRYRDPKSWKEDIAIANITGHGDVLDAIRGSGIQDNDLALAFEQFDHVRWFINWIEISNTSTHAVATKASISIARRAGQSEVLTGTLTLNGQQRYFIGAAEKLLPREHLWALLRTRRPIRTADIEVTADPTAFFDPHSAWKVVPILTAVAIAWIVGNVLGRSHERRRRTVDMI